MKVSTYMKCGTPWQTLEREEESTIAMCDNAAGSFYRSQTLIYLLDLIYKHLSTYQTLSSAIQIES